MPSYMGNDAVLTKSEKKCTFTEFYQYIWKKIYLIKEISKMKKKIALMVLIFAMLVTPVFALGGVSEDNSFGVGLNLGTNTGVGLRFGFGDFDILSNIGFDVLNVFSGNFVLAGDVTASWNFYTIDGGRGLEFPLTVGVGANTAIAFNDGVSASLSAIVPVGIEYNFSQISDVPITMYLRLAPGLRIISANRVDVGFAFAGYLGAIWNF